MPECLFLSISVMMTGESCIAPTREDRLERLVLGRRSLEAQDVGAVDCETTELWFVSEEMVVADRDEVIAFTSGKVREGRMPRSRASRSKDSSTWDSVAAGCRARMELR